MTGKLCFCGRLMIRYLVVGVTIGIIIGRQFIKKGAADSPGRG